MRCGETKEDMMGGVDGRTEEEETVMVRGEGGVVKGRLLTCFFPPREQNERVPDKNRTRLASQLYPNSRISSTFF